MSTYDRTLITESGMRAHLHIRDINPKPYTHSLNRHESADQGEPKSRPLTYRTVWGCGGGSTSTNLFLFCRAAMADRGTSSPQQRLACTLVCMRELVHATCVCMPLPARPRQTSLRLGKDIIRWSVLTVPPTRAKWWALKD